MNIGDIDPKKLNHLAELIGTVYQLCIPPETSPFRTSDLSFIKHLPNRVILESPDKSAGIKYKQAKAIQTALTSFSVTQKTNKIDKRHFSEKKLRRLVEALEPIKNMNIEKSVSEPTKRYLKNFRSASEQQAQLEKEKKNIALSPNNYFNTSVEHHAGKDNYHSKSEIERSRIITKEVFEILQTSAKGISAIFQDIEFSILKNHTVHVEEDLNEDNELKAITKKLQKAFTPIRARGVSASTKTNLALFTAPKKLFNDKIVTHSQVRQLRDAFEAFDNKTLKTIKAENKKALKAAESENKKLPKALTALSPTADFSKSVTGNYIRATNNRILSIEGAEQIKNLIAQAYSLIQEKPLTKELAKRAAFLDIPVTYLQVTNKNEDSSVITLKPIERDIV